MARQQLWTVQKQHSTKEGRSTLHAVTKTRCSVLRPTDIFHGVFCLGKGPSKQSWKKTSQFYIFSSTTYSCDWFCFLHNCDLIPNVGIDWSLSLSTPQACNNRHHRKESLHLCTRHPTSVVDNPPDKSRQSMGAVAEFVLFSF